MWAESRRNFPAIQPGHVHSRAIVPEALHWPGTLVWPGSSYLLWDLQAAHEEEGVEDDAPEEAAGASSVLVDASTAGNTMNCDGPISTDQ